MEALNEKIDENNEKMEEQMTRMRQKIAEVNDKWKQTNQELQQTKENIDIRILNLDENNSVRVESLRKTTEGLLRVRTDFGERCMCIDTTVNEVRGRLN